MADFFVDASATGTGDGLTPANAKVSVYSVTYAKGVKAWVRRTHIETAVSTLGYAYVVADPSQAWIIGWPDVNDPFYSSRPALASAWDSDVPTTQAYSSYSYKWPTLVGSTNNNNVPATRLSGNISVTNFYFVNCGGAGAIPLFGSSDSIPNPIIAELGKFMFLYNNGPMNFSGGMGTGGIRYRHFICATSRGPTGNAFAFELENCDTFEVHSTSNAYSLFGQTSRLQVDHIINNSNSIAYGITMSAYNGANNSKVNAGIGLRRCSGIPFNIGLASSFGFNSQWWEGCDDYFGQGPVRFTSITKGGYTLAASAAAMYGTSQAMRHQINSEATGNWSIDIGVDMNPIIGKTFAVVSGTPITIHVPIYVGSPTLTNGVFSPAYGRMGARMLIAGGDEKFAGSADVSPGSASQWSGTLIGAGSAYVAAFTFNPRETYAQAKFEFFSGKWGANSDAPFTNYALFGEPY